MPNFLVELPAGTPVSNMGDATRRMVIFAADAAGARRAAEGRYDGDGNALWATLATVTELVVGTVLADAGDVDGWQAYARISGGTGQVIDPIVASARGQTKDFEKGVVGRDRIHVGAVALDDGGTATYVIDDILTAAGGTFTRAATFRVITVSTGVILTVELVDPGEYTVAPTPLLANPVTGGGGTLATLDLTLALVGSYEALLAQLLTELDTFTEITPSLDLSEGAAGTRLLTLATVGDDLGGAAIEVEIRHNGTVETVLMSTIVDEGIDAAVLTAAIPAIPIVPPRIRVYQ